MATTVWSTTKGSRGELQQVQVNLSEIVATLSAIRSFWGWAGGLDTLKNLATRWPRLFKRQELERLGAKLELAHSSYRIIVPGRVIIFEESDAQEAFSGDVITQVVGSVICALNHELGLQRVISLFMDDLSPFLIEPGHSTEILRAFITDNAQQILCEGDSRGLKKRFLDVVRDSSILLVGQTIDDSGTDYPYVSGLLRWLGKGEQKPYLTRSVVVARIAAYLKCLGLPISDIVAWNGSESSPKSCKGVILVTGGSKETDQLMGDANKHLHGLENLTQHYRYETIGSMFVNMSTHNPDLTLHLLQDDFVRIEEYIRGRLSFKWKAGDALMLHAVFTWTRERNMASATSIATQLASKFFGDSAPNLAFLYNDVASEETLAGLKLLGRSNNQKPSSSVKRCLTVTTSIILSVIGILGGPKYRTLNHATTMLLLPGNVESLSRAIGRGLSTGFVFWKAVILVAVFHSSATLSTIMPMLNQDDEENCEIIGYRNCGLAVLPAVFFNLAPGEEALGLQCVDELYALPAVQADGFIRSEISETWYPEALSLKRVRNRTSHDLLAPGGINFNENSRGSASDSPVDITVYMGLERLPSYSKEPYLCLAARVDGILSGTTGVLDVIWVTVRSLETPQSCPSQGHSSRLQAWNVNASQWMSNRLEKPVRLAPEINRLFADGSPEMALLLAGQVASDRGIVVFRCFECAFDTMLRLETNDSEREPQISRLLVDYSSARSNQGGRSDAILVKRQ